MHETILVYHSRPNVRNEMLYPISFVIAQSWLVAVSCVISRYANDCISCVSSISMLAQWVIEPPHERILRTILQIVHIPGNYILFLIRTCFIPDGIVLTVAQQSLWALLDPCFSGGGLHPDFGRRRKPRSGSDEPNWAKRLRKPDRTENLRRQIDAN